MTYDAPKKDKTEVDYSQGHAGSRCGICTYFVPPYGCQKVRGEIMPHMWCNLFKLDPKKRSGAK